MSPFDKLDPHIRAVALVGQFLQVWALMESTINEVIAKALDLETLQGIILCANMQFRDKTNVLRTAVNLSAIYPPEKRAAYDKTLIAIQEYSSTRNMMAHDMFRADKTTGGVSFSVTRAKGKLQFPNVVWELDDFKKAYTKLQHWSGEMEKLAADLDTASLITAMIAAKTRDLSAREFPTPSGIALGRGLLNLPVPPLPADPSSDTNRDTPDKDDKTPPSSRADLDPVRPE